MTRLIATGVVLAQSKTREVSTTRAASARRTLGLACQNDGAGQRQSRLLQWAALLHKDLNSCARNAALLSAH